MCLMQYSAEPQEPEDLVEPQEEASEVTMYASAFGVVRDAASFSDFLP